MDALSKWLEGLGLQRYVEVFVESDVDFDAVRLLSDSDLERLGISLGHRRKLLRAIDELNSRSATEPAALPIDRQAAPEPSIVVGGERRQLTVLFCDMVGFTELANRVDPEVLQGIVRSYEDACAVCITRYEGYVFQRLGDGIVAFFGYPLAHEGEAERAIRAGLEIIESLSKLYVPDAGHLAVRIGIATGLVVVSSAEKGAVGETMNLASRLQAIAQPGSIVVSERVHRLAGGAFDYEDLGEQSLKGIAQPTHAHRILGVSEAASRFDAATGEGLTPLVGREQEIGLLLERWALARDGEGQVVLLSGEPGIGKSRLLSALRERLGVQGAQALRFQCSPYYVNSAFWPSIDNFERALKFARDEQPESKLDKLEALIVAHYGRPLSDVRFVASILSIPCEERYGELPMTPQKHKDETLRTLVDLTEAAARKQPSVMLFEDVHWADPTTLEVLDLLVDRVRGFPLLIVLTHRPEFQSRWGSHGHVTGLNLSKLTRAQSAEMVSRLAGGKALPSDLLEQILAKTDGVPLFVEELTKSILESGELKEVADRYEYAGSARSITIPATLRDSLMARLDRFTPVKEMAQIGATIGREFSYELIAAVAPMSQSQLDGALAQLTDSGLAFRRGTPPEATYTFKHALVRDAAYDSLLKSRRQELHAKIARVIEVRFPKIMDTEPDLLAQHYTAASLTDQAIPYWLKAGQTAVRRTAFVEAAAHLKKGLELLESLPPSVNRDRQELDFLSVLMPVHITLTGWSSDELLRIATRARELSERFGETELLTGIWFVLWLVHSCRATYPQSLEVAAKAIRTGESAKETGFKVVGYSGNVMSRGWMGDFSGSRDAVQKLIANYDFERHNRIVFSTNHDPLCGALSWASHFHWVAGWPDQAKQAALQQLELARRLNHPFNLIWALAPGAGAFMYCGESGTFVEWVSEATRIAEEQALGFALDMIIGAFGGMGLIWFGRHEEGYQKVKRGVDMHAAAGNRVVIPMFQTSMADALGKMGRVEEALALITHALTRIAETGEGFYAAEAHRIRGGLVLARGQPREAEAALMMSLEVARGQSAKGWELRTATSLARLWQSRGKRKQAYELLAPVYDWFTEGFDTRDLIEAKSLLEELRA